MNIGGFSHVMFNVISAFLADNNQRFVAEVEVSSCKHELDSGPTAVYLELNTRVSAHRFADFFVCLRRRSPRMRDIRLGIV
jgi:hypothetical protein